MISSTHVGMTRLSVVTAGIACLPAAGDSFLG